MPPSDEPAVYFDETGNSGQNLLDPGQPIFALAGVHLSTDEAAAVVATVRSQLPATQGEPKYSSLAKAARGRKALLQAFREMPASSVRAVPVHKRFMAMTKMVDLLVEPMAHANGFNIYERQGALALAEMLHQVCPVIGDGDAYDRMLQTFVDWIREKVGTDELFGAIGAFKATVQDDDFAEWFELVEHCRPIADSLARDIASGKTKDILDPAVPSLYWLGRVFGESLGEFRLVHDTSKVIIEGAALLRALHFFPDPARPGMFVEQLPVSRIDFADSKAHPQLQLADWAAGAARQVVYTKMAGTVDPFAEQLEPLVWPWLIGTIWPGVRQ